MSRRANFDPSRTGATRPSGGWLRFEVEAGSAWDWPNGFDPQPRIGFDPQPRIGFDPQPRIGFDP
jgi:hypothetical protein